MFKRFLVMFLFVTLVTGLLFGCSGNNSSTSKTSPTKTVETKPEKKVYKFNNDQIAFLQKLGIKKVEDAEDKGRFKEFNYDGELITVEVNDKNGITEVSVGNDGKPLWNDKKGKIGMLKAEKLAFLDKFIDSRSQNYDQAQQITWVDSIGTYPLGHKGVYTYMGIKGREKSGQKWLRATLHYSGSEWIFFNKVVFSNTQETWTYQVPKRPTHQVVMGGIHEYSDIPFEDIKRGMEIIAYGENPKIDFFGKEFHDDKNCTAQEVENARTYLILSDALKLQ